MATSSMGENIRRLRKEKSLTLENVAQAVGVSRQTIQRYETGCIANIPPENIKKIAEVFATTPGHIMGWEDEVAQESSRLTSEEKHLIKVYRRLDGTGKKMVDDILAFASRKQKEAQESRPARFASVYEIASTRYTKEIPLPGSASAGLGVSAIEEYDTIMGPDEADFALFVEGDSMEPKFHDGDVVYLREQPSLEDYEIGVLQIMGSHDFVPRAYLKQLVQGRYKTVILRSLNSNYKDMHVSADTIRVLGKVISSLSPTK